ncbi:MAG: uracil phosphoribosyltransferase [Verrucomicrobiia bacterium AMD-G2]|nr:MAG: uracil phosphoribosyltransferase [Verrucomicrobiae bacterium AMD-G2]
MPLRLLQHPLAAHILTHLRDRTTKPALFRNLSYQLSLILALEATRDLETVEKQIETPLAPHTGRVLARSLVVVPILRAGLGMVQPFQDIFPDISVGYIGLERDHETAEARSYYCKLPPVADTRTIVVDPMLATGGSAAKALQLVKDHGASDVSLVCILGSPEGVETVARAHPEVPIILGVLDESLNANKYIVPGLGDFGDRLYGTHA